jgi:chemotaxis protein histidine kinase CheA/ActR/RegA family two-component response regulator
MLPEQQQRIMGYFIEEAKDHLNTIEQGLLNLQATIEDPEMANEVFRAAHSVKGGAAMLGIESVQRTAHRMEDYFKVLKESPIQVDRALESMFLQVFDALQELLEQLQGPFGLTDDKAQEIMVGVEPVFVQLHDHLNSLVAVSGGIQSDVAQPPAIKAGGRSMARSAVTGVGEDSALQLVFKSDVSACLREMLSLFKQDDTSQSRRALQEVCHKLRQFGEQFELPAWIDLIQTTHLVLEDSSNDYRTLAPVLIKNIKSAQDLVLAGRDAEIAVSDGMQSLVPADLMSPGDAITNDLDDLFEDPAEKSGLTETDTFQDLFSGEVGSDAETEASTLGLSLDGDPSIDMTSVDFLEELGDGGLGKGGEAETNSSLGSGSDESFDDLFSTGADPMGPEVGAAELNSLADLFEGDLGDLDAAWQDEESVVDSLQDTSELLDVDISSDFADLLEDSGSSGDLTAAFDSGDELADLFGEVFAETTDSTEGVPGASDWGDNSGLDLSSEGGMGEGSDAAGLFAGDSTDLDADNLDLDLGDDEAANTDAVLNDFEDLEGILGLEADEDTEPSELEAALDVDVENDLGSVFDFDGGATPVSVDADLENDFDLDALEESSDINDAALSEAVDTLEGDMDFGAELDSLGTTTADALPEVDFGLNDLEDLEGTIDASLESDTDAGEPLNVESMATVDADLTFDDLDLDTDMDASLEDAIAIADIDGVSHESSSDAGVDEEGDVGELNLADDLDVALDEPSVSELDLFPSHEERQGQDADGGADDFSDFFDADSGSASTSTSLEGMTDEIDDFFDAGLAAVPTALEETPDVWEDASSEAVAASDEGLAAVPPTSDWDLPGSDVTEELWDVEDSSLEGSGAEHSGSDSFDQSEGLDLELATGVDSFEEGNLAQESLVDFADEQLADLGEGSGSGSETLSLGAMLGEAEADLGLVEDAEAASEPDVALSDMFESIEEGVLADLSPMGEEDFDLDAIGNDDQPGDDLTSQSLVEVTDDLNFDFDLDAESVDDLELLEAFTADEAGAQDLDAQSAGSLADFGIEADEDFSLNFDDQGVENTEEAVAIAPDPSRGENVDLTDAMGFMDLDLAELSDEDLALDDDLSSDLDASLGEASSADELDALLTDEDMSDTVSPVEFDRDTSMGLVDESLLDDLELSEAEGGDGDVEADLESAQLESGLEMDITEGLETNLTDEMSEVDSLSALVDNASESEDSLEEVGSEGWGELDDLAVLMDEVPEFVDSQDDATPEFDDLAALIDEVPEPVESTGELEEGSNDHEFDDLEALLGDTPEPEASYPFEGASGVNEFSDLDALLAEETPVDEPSDDSDSDAEEDNEFEDLERLLEEADQTLGGPAGASTTRRPAVANRLGGGRRAGGVLSEQTMRVSVKHLDNLSNLVGELVVNRNTLEQDQERLRQFLDNLLFQVQQLNDVGQRMRDLYERSLLESSLISSRQNYQLAAAMDSSASALSSHATGETFDALEMDRFTGFHTLSQEMIELIVRVRESSSDIAYTVESSDQVTRQFRQVTTQLQEGLNKARMVPFAQTADRLPRAVRDISLKCGKEARLVVEGRDTLIDKMILEQLYDPMTHLVNNAITHGIETPDIREGAGKPREGTITVRAFYQGNQTVIYVADDGGGIDPDLVKQKAVQKGLLSSAEAKSISVLDVYELLFHPGFSTRDQADDFAGRGVGMDVVRTSLAEIRGSITIDSELGKGTSFTIRLPLTLSISKALSCISNQARIAFPMDGVEDMFDVPRERIQQNAQGQQCILWRDTLLPFQQLSELLKFNRTLGRGRVYGGHQDDDVISIVVLRSASTYIALEVDQVIGEQEIVIKQLEGPVPKPAGIAGATVLGDGRVMPIADVLELIDLAMGRVRRDPSTALWSTQIDTAVPEEPAATKSEPTVLIVDDSITVRELLSMSFNKVGYRVEQARDGQEAWEKLRAGLPCDLVFCDIEMPRMDGLELLSRLQKDNALKRIPIAMLTSRGADRHRQMAVDLGASGYFTKPYLEEALLDAAQKMLSGAKLV